MTLYSILPPCPKYPDFGLYSREKHRVIFRCKTQEEADACLRDANRGGLGFMMAEAKATIDDHDLFGDLLI